MVIQGPWKPPNLKEQLLREAERLLRLIEEYREQEKGKPGS
ncbi:hypothetical protein EDE08_101671 [Bradyrhizobium sp. R2.2-H]|jgi:hypothetical protein|nr:hypothetical protein EDE10_101672 [Bradyrhizobium sp. Y-H1]TCU80971.1 hypothetical protein EDE08_101671 [Bradyrhizobium sp. R2.2-H]